MPVQKSILCTLNVHKWSYFSETMLSLNIDNSSYVQVDNFRECVRCNIKQELDDEGEPRVSAAKAEWRITEFPN